MLQWIANATRWCCTICRGSTSQHDVKVLPTWCGIFNVSFYNGDMVYVLHTIYIELSQARKQPLTELLHWLCLPSPDVYCAVDCLNRICICICVMFIVCLYQTYQYVRTPQFFIDRICYCICQVSVVDCLRDGKIDIHRFAAVSRFRNKHEEGGWVAKCGDDMICNNCMLFWRTWRLLFNILTKENIVFLTSKISTL